jgi:hypothetical protein
VGALVFSGLLRRPAFESGVRGFEAAATPRVCVFSSGLILPLLAMALFVLLSGQSLPDLPFVFCLSFLCLLEVWQFRRCGAFSPRIAYRQSSFCMLTLFQFLKERALGAGDLAVFSAIAISSSPVVPFADGRPLHWHSAPGQSGCPWFPRHAGDESRNHFYFEACRMEGWPW